MKSKIIVSFLVIACLVIGSSMIFSGCFGGDDTGNTQSQESVQEKKTGILKSLGGMTVGEGTHLLELTDGTTIRLKSLNINLDSDKYLNKKVEVRGTITKATDGKDLMDVKSIDLAEETVTDASTLTGVNKEYQNADMGFKLTYLDNWQVKEETNTVTFSAPKSVSETEDLTTLETDSVIITRYLNSGKKTIEGFLNLPTDPNELVTLNYTQIKVGPDMLDGLKKASADQNEMDTYIARNDYIYKISFKGTNSLDVINNRNSYFSILGSFQFIGFTSAEVTTTETTTTTTPAETEPDTVNNPTTTETTTTTTPTTETAPTTTTTTNTTSSTTYSPSSSSYGLVSQYISQSLSTIAPEAPATGTWSAYSFEFAKPNYVYVVYGNGTEKRRVLLTYTQDGSQLSTDVVGYFKPGETTSWTRVSGTNPVESAEKTVISLGDTGAQESAVVKEGYRYFESSAYDFQAQYPSNWYYSGSGSAGDTLHHYGFSNQPVENGNELVSIDIVSGSLPSGSPISVGANQGVKVTANGETSIYIQRSDGTLYKVHGSSGNDAYIVDIAASIENTN